MKALPRLAVTVACLFGSAESVAVAVTFGDVADAWNASGPVLHAVECRWTARRWHAAGTLLNVAVTASEEDRQSHSPPSVETTRAATLTLVGRELFHRWEGPDWVPHAARVEWQSQILSIDAVARRQFFSGRQGHPESLAEIRAHAAEGIELPLVPLMAYLRPLDPIVGPFRDRENWRLRGEPERVEGRECFVLEHRREWFAPQLSAADYVRRVYLDPARGYSVVRWTEWGGGNLIVQIDIDCAQHDGLWLPAAWHTQVFRAREPHDLIEEQTAADVRWTIGDVAEPPQFSELLPPGTLVRDQRTQGAWIVRADGTHRPVTPDELARGVSRAELLALPPGWAGRPMAYRASAALTWDVPLALLLAAAGLVYRRWRFATQTVLEAPAIATNREESAPQDAGAEKGGE